MTLGVIGCGRMGTALVAGAIDKQALAAAEVLGYDPLPEARERFNAETGAATVDAIEAFADRDALLLCTKPQQAAAALAALGEADAGTPLLVSIAAGLPLEWLAARAPRGSRLIRCMPNTPALIGEGAAAFARANDASDEDADFARRLLGSVGLAVEVPESLLDAVTGLSGSGPAYGYLAIEALADGGVRCGLPREQALQLAAWTLRGAASMVLETGRHPGELKDMVTSPGGTTIAGLAELERRGFRAALIEAVAAAARRAGELGKP